jgi:hypothetical protein|tara:strand:- start:376 stop:1305 length:930 start_codon:yes stop_codon:yes gene_type:complete
MKKTVFLIAMLMVGSLFHVVQAQDVLTNKKGKVMLPENGDWSVSIDATSFIKFAADVAHVGGEGVAVPPTFKGLNDLAETYSISGRQFISATKARRVSVRVFADNNMTSVLVNPNGFVAQDWPNDVSDAQVKDVKRERNNMVALGYGMEYRKGVRRLQGYYGYEAMIAIESKGKSYKYGNDLAANFTSHDFGGNLNGAQRTTQTREGMNVAIGGRGFIGAEYFVVPKISIGGEFGLGAGIYRNFGGKVVTEGIDVSGAAQKDVVRKAGDANGGFFIGNARDNGGQDAVANTIWMNSFSPSANLSLNIYF